MQPREKKAFEEKIRMNETIKKAIVRQQKLFPQDDPLDFYKHLPLDFQFAREDIFHVLESEEENFHAIFFNFAALFHPPLFLFILERTPIDIINEAAGYREPEGLFINTWHFILSKKNKSEANQMASVLLGKITIDTFYQAITTPFMGFLQPLLHAADNETLFRMLIEKMDSVRLDHWLESVPFGNARNTVPFILNLKNHHLIELILKKASDKTINQLFSSHDFLYLFHADTYCHQNIVDLLGLKLTQETIERCLLGRGPRLNAQGIADLCKPKGLFKRLFADAKDELNPNVLRLLPLLSDRLVLKIVEQLMQQKVSFKSSISLLDDISINHSSFFNALVYRLEKIEKWGGVYQRIKENPILLKNINSDMITQFFAIYPDEFKKISQSLFSQGFHFFGSEKSRYKKAENDYRCQVSFINTVFYYLHSHSNIIDPIIRIIIEYCVTDHNIFSSIYRSIEDELKKESEKKPDKMNTVMSLTPVPILKLDSQGHYRFFDSKGIDTDTRQLSSLFSQVLSDDNQYKTSSAVNKSNRKKG